MRLLRDAGAELDLTDHALKTAIHIAAERGRVRHLCGCPTYRKLRVCEGVTSCHVAT